MAKVAVLAFLAVFALAHAATAFRTTVTTTVVEDDENPGWGRQSCQRQIRMQQQLHHCQKHLREKCRSHSMLSMSVKNPGQEEEEGEQYLDECCQQLRNIDKECRCQGLQQVVRQIVQEEREQEGTRGKDLPKEAEVLIREALEIPSKCNIRPRSCTFSRPE